LIFSFALGARLGEAPHIPKFREPWRRVGFFLFSLRLLRFQRRVHSGHLSCVYHCSDFESIANYFITLNQIP